MDIIGIYLFDQNMGMAFVKARCTHIPLALVKSRSALSPFGFLLLLRTCDSVIFNTFHAGEEISCVVVEK